MRWYADNSELNGIRGAAIPDILLFGGIAVPPETDKELRLRIEEVKGRHGHTRAPIKWNFKDLRPLYRKQNQDELHAAMLSASKEWRMELADAVADLDFTIIIACIESHSIDRKIIKTTKEDLTRFVFSNGLMRVALHTEETKPERTQVVLDWPDRGDSNPFDSEYASAYNAGETKGGHVKYHSGPLMNLGFTDSAVYTNMYHSTLLQFSDVILGATRELVECATGKKATGFGVDFSKKLAHKYRGYPKHIFGRGISVASGNSDFRKGIKEYISNELQSV